MQQHSLSRDWQCFLLTDCPGLVIPDRYCNQKSVTKHFMKGIYALGGTEEIQLAPSRFRDEIHRVYRAVFQHPARSNRLGLDVASRKRADREANPKP